MNQTHVMNSIVLLFIGLLCFAMMTIADDERSRQTLFVMGAVFMIASSAMFAIATRPKQAKEARA